MKKYKNKNFLYQKYIVNKLSLVEVAKLDNCSSHTIFVWLKKYKIAIRNRSEAQKLKIGKFNQNYRPLEERLWDKIDKKDNISECWMWNNPGTLGYGQIGVGKQMKPAHLITYELFYKDKILKNEIVHHLCGNKLCCNPFHLIKMTRSKHTLLHQKDKIGSRGEKNGQAKFKEWQVLEIRAKYKTGKYTQRQLRNEYDCSKSTISCIINRKTWRYTV